MKRPDSFPPTLGKAKRLGNIQYQGALRHETGKKSRMRARVMAFVVVGALSLGSATAGHAAAASEAAESAQTSDVVAAALDAQGLLTQRTAMYLRVMRCAVSP